VRGGGGQQEEGNLFAASPNAIFGARAHLAPKKVTEYIQQGGKRVVGTDRADTPRDPSVVILSTRPGMRSVGAIPLRSRRGDYADERGRRPPYRSCQLLTASCQGDTTAVSGQEQRTRAIHSHCPLRAQEEDHTEAKTRISLKAEVKDVINSIV